MTKAGRIYGRISADGTAYELVQYGEVRQSMPIAQVHANERLKWTIHRNQWEPLP